MRKLEVWVLLLILLGGFLVRIYRFNNPIADWHSWRQADTSAVSRNFVQYGFDLLHPRFDDLSNVASGYDNPKGYRFVEFPIYNAVQAGLFGVFGGLGLLGLTLEQWGRLVTIFSSLISTVFLYLIVKKHKSKLAGLLTAFFFAFLPYNIYYGRTILPDSSMVMAILGGIYFFDRWLGKFEIRNSSFDSRSGRPEPVERAKSEMVRQAHHPEQSRRTNSKFKTASFAKASEGKQNSKPQLKSQIFFILSIIFTASAFLLKPYAMFFTLPMVYIAFERFGFYFIKKWQLWLFFIISLAPLVFWRLWILQYPEGIPVTDWLFNGDNIRFKGAFFYWIFADRIGRLILGYWGVVLLVLGVLVRGDRKNGLFFPSFLASSLLYLTVMARGNVQHDYYQILIIPSIAIFLGLGSAYLLKAQNENLSKASSYLAFVICSLFMFSFGWYNVRDYFNINNSSIVIAGEVVDKLTPKDAKIIANYNGDTSFLYQTKRKGWASFEKPIPEMIDMGASYLVLVNPTKNDYGIGKTYKIVSATKDYILFDLHKNP